MPNDADRLEINWCVISMEFFFFFHVFIVCSDGIVGDTFSKTIRRFFLKNLKKEKKRKKLQEDLERSG